MKKSTLLLSAALLAGSMALSALNAAPVQYVEGKSLCRFTSGNIHLMCYSQGTPQFHTVRPDQRFGGLSIEVDGKPVKGTRSQKDGVVTYSFPNDGKLTILINGEKKVQLTASFPGAKKLNLSFFIKTAAFAGTSVKVNGAEYPLEINADAAPGNRKLFQEKTDLVSFGSGNADRAFSVKMAEKAEAVLHNSPKTGNAFFHILPAKPAEPFSFTFEN